MPYIQYNDRKISPAKSSDVERLFLASDMLPGLKVAIDDAHFIQATVLTDSALIIYCDEKTPVAMLPKTVDNNSVNRAETLEILKRFLDSEELHPDFTWTKTDQIPYLKSRWGCGNVLLVAAFLATTLLAMI